MPEYERKPIPERLAAIAHQSKERWNDELKKREQLRAEILKLFGPVNPELAKRFRPLK